MELGNFPLDYQKLNITFASQWWYVDFKKDTKQPDRLEHGSFAGIHEFDMAEDISAEHLEIYLDKDENPFNQYQLTMYVFRKATYYFWNVALITSLLMLLTFTSLTVPYTDVADRLAVTFTLLLTSVAFKFAVSETLPKIQYLTMLDKHVLFNMFVQVFVAVENAFSSLFTSLESPKLFDHVCIGVLGLVILIFHVALGSIVIHMIRDRKMEISKAKAKKNQGEKDGAPTTEQTGKVRSDALVTIEENEDTASDDDSDDHAEIPLKGGKRHVPITRRLST